MNILITVLGQIPEAIFIALFMIFAKNLKTKRLLFTFIMIAEYLLLMNLFAYNWMFHILYAVLAFIAIKLLYKDKSEITDIFIFATSYIAIIISSMICYVISSDNVIVGCIINRIMLFVPLLIVGYDLHYIEKVYRKYWNRNDKIKKKIKSVTFRSINVVVFNLLFYVINACMVCAIAMKGGV